MLPDVRGHSSAASKAELKSEGHDAPCGRPDPRVSMLTLWGEEVVAGGHVHRLGGHLLEVEELRLLWPVGGDDCGSNSKLSQLEGQFVEQLPWWVAPVVFPPPLLA